MTVTLDYPDVVALQAEIGAVLRKNRLGPQTNGDWLPLMENLAAKLDQAHAELHAATEAMGKGRAGWPIFELALRMPHRNPDFIMTVPLSDAPLPSLNILSREKGRFVKSAWIKRFMDEILYRLYSFSPGTRQKFPFAKADLQLTIYYTGIEPDLDNVYGGACKIIGDALVRSGIVSDDKPSVLTVRPITMIRVPKKAERRVCVEVWKAEDMTHAQT